MKTAQDVMDVMHSRWLVRRVWEDVGRAMMASAETYSRGLNSIHTPAGPEWHEREYKVSDCVRIENPYWRNHHKSLH